MQWCVFYTELGRELVRCFGQNEKAAREFAKTEENARVKYTLR